jgi:hypothetical protein
MPRLVSLLAALTGFMGFMPLPSQAALFQAKEVKGEAFVLVAAPIGDGSSSQLNIYEQVRDRRPCFSKEGNAPTVVKPLLGGFDFTGICNRFIDSNGYSVRIGDQDYGPDMRLSVVNREGETVLLGSDRDGGTLVIARTGGSAPGFLELKMEPGWKLMRRHFGPRALGHVYIYRENLPE